MLLVQYDNTPILSSSFFEKLTGGIRRVIIDTNNFDVVQGLRT